MNPARQRRGPRERPAKRSRDRPERRRRHFTRWRRAVQAAVAVFFVALPVLHVLGFWAVKGNLASLDLGPVDLVEPAAAASSLLAARAVGLGVVLGVLAPVLLALVLGPVFCSWVCPWGLFTETLDRMRGRRRRWRPDAFERVRRPRGIVLGSVALLSAVVGAPLAALISAPRLLTALPFEAVFLGVVSPVTGGLLLGLLVLELAGPRRLWCRALCPVGALANYLRTPRTLTIRTDMEACRCPGVPTCQTRCAWGVDPRRMRLHDGCTSCLACVEACPTGALSAGFGRPRHPPCQPRVAVAPGSHPIRS